MTWKHGWAFRREGDSFEISAGHHQAGQEHLWKSAV